MFLLIEDFFKMWEEIRGLEWKLPFNNEAGSRLSERKNGVFSHSLLLDEICEFCRDKLLFFSNCWIKAHFMRRLKEGL